MSEERIYSYEPLWGSWRVDGVLGEGSFGMVYRVYRDDLGQRIYSAVKVISISQNDGQLSELFAAGMNAETMRGYCQSFVREITGELGLMQRFRGNSNIVSYEDHFVVERQDVIGADIVLRMELLTPLNNYINQKGFFVADVIAMGIDICRALELCAMHSIVHRDIKPGNIFISESGSFKIGDFGIARSIEKGTGELSKKGTYSYMAPEVYCGSPYDATIDLYSLGIVMYRLLNSYRLPFLPLPPQNIDYGDNEKALSKRLGGYPMPSPVAAPEPLARVVLKACEYLPENRFQSAADMRAALEEVLEMLRRGEITNHAVLAPGDTPATNIIERPLAPHQGPVQPPPIQQQSPIQNQYQVPPQPVSDYAVSPQPQPSQSNEYQQPGTGEKRTAGYSDGAPYINNSSVARPTRVNAASDNGVYQRENPKYSPNSGLSVILLAKFVNSAPVQGIKNIFGGLKDPRRRTASLISIAAVIAAISVIGFSVFFVLNNGSVAEITENAIIGEWQTDNEKMSFKFSKSGTVYTCDEDWNTTIGIFEVTDGETVTVNYSDSSEVYKAYIKKGRLYLTDKDGKKTVLNKISTDN